MAIHLTPTELGREAGMHRREVISKCMEMGVPIFQGRIDKTLFTTASRRRRRRGSWRSRPRRYDSLRRGHKWPRALLPIESPRGLATRPTSHRRGRGMEAVTARAPRRARARRRSPTCCRWRSRSTPTSPAQRHKVGDEWVDISYAELGEAVKRGRARAGRPRRRAGRQGLDPRPHPSRVDRRLLRHPHRGRHARHDLPDQLARGVPVRARTTPTRGRCSSRTPSSWPRSARSASECPELRTSS